MRKNVESWQIGKGQDIYKDIQKHLVKQTLTLSVQTLRSPPDRNTNFINAIRNAIWNLLHALEIRCVFLLAELYIFISISILCIFL